MKFARRILLFLAINFLVVLTISTILNLLGLRPYITAQGLNYNSLLIFCVIWGMGGAFISLLLSKKIAKWMLGVQIISADTQDPSLQKLLRLVEDLSRKANLKGTPELGIFHSPEPNAFATGPSERRSLVAVSSGLLNKMDLGEIEAVLGHEISHIGNGDMVTMTLIQGIVNVFVMFFARILAYALSGLGRNRSRGGSYMSYYLFSYLFEIVFMLLGSIAIAAFSRFREYRADTGGATIAGKEKMISALKSLQHAFNTRDANLARPSLRALMIKESKNRRVLVKLFSTHPPLEKRIQKLKDSF